jgi:hypothetical protein
MHLRFSRIALTCCALALAGCANGGTIATTGSGGGSGSTSGSGGSAQTATTDAVTTGPSCVEQPCKLTAPQCGCDAGEQCALDASNERVCAPMGSVPIGQPCDETATCAPGGICVGYSATTNTCAEFCKTDDVCDSPGGLCVITLGDGAGGTVPDVLLCSDNCDLVTSQGCTQADTACQLGLTQNNQPFTLCVPSGTGLDQDLCADSSECAPGYACLPTTNNDNRCFQWCRVGGPACDDATLTCTALEVTTGVELMIGSETFGVCNPS